MTEIPPEPRKVPEFFHTISLHLDPKQNVMVWKFRLKWWHPSFWKKFFDDITKVHVKYYKPAEGKK